MDRDRLKLGRQIQKLEPTYTSNGTTGKYC